METAVKPVQNGRGRKRQWPAEQKLAVLQEWKNGVPLEEVCRKYSVNAAQMYRWKRSLDQGLKESGEMVPKSQVLGLQKRVEELERALGRKALEVDVFKKPSSSRDSHYPRGCKVVGEDGGMFVDGGVPGPGQAAELALLSAAVRAWVAGEAAGGGRGNQRALGGQSGVLRLPADPRAAQAPGAGLRSQDGVANHAPTWVAGDRSAPAGTIGTTARGASAGGRTKPAMGVGHHGHPGVGWTEGALGDHDRL